MGDVIQLYGDDEYEPMQELRNAILDAIMTFEEPMTIAEVVGVLETVKYEILKLGEQDYIEE